MVRRSEPRQLGGHGGAAVPRGAGVLGVEILQSLDSAESRFHGFDSMGWTNHKLNPISRLCVNYSHAMQISTVQCNQSQYSEVQTVLLAVCFKTRHCQDKTRKNHAVWHNAGHKHGRQGFRIHADTMLCATLHHSTLQCSTI